jgi:hypothetical protein
MFRNELDMLQCRLESMQEDDVLHVLVESPVTHRGVPKPLVYQENRWRFLQWADQIVHVVAHPQQAEPWAREHAQRNAAWPVIAEHAADDDTVLICDLDEIPSAALLAWKGGTAVAARMRTALFAVDWEVPQHLLPPTCVAATVAWLRQEALRGYGLAEVRDRRGEFPVLTENGGWHLSWLGGPQAQREKLDTASCHQEEIDATPEGELIRDGTRWRTAENGGGLPVVPVDVTEEWPRYVWERRCPASWFRPRSHQPDSAGATGYGRT